MGPIAEIVSAREAARRAGDSLVDVCYLATVTAAGWPEARALSLREVDEQGAGLLLNRTSPKWSELMSSGHGTLLIHWPSVRRQYRWRGVVAPMPPERMARHWSHKSRGSQLLEHYYETFQPQSQSIASRDVLLAGIQDLARRYPETIPMPSTLAGVLLVPHEIESWHGSPEDRLHDRRLWRREASGWSSQPLVP